MANIFKIISTVLALILTYFEGRSKHAQEKYVKWRNNIEKNIDERKRRADIISRLRETDKPKLPD